MATSASAIGPARPALRCSRGAGEPLRRPLLRMLYPPPPAQPSPTPAPRHPGCAAGPKPEVVSGSREADAPAQPGDHGDPTSSQAPGHRTLTRALEPEKRRPLLSPWADGARARGAGREGALLPPLRWQAQAGPRGEEGSGLCGLL
uniref:Uncharacterized protein n=1 Tax=Rangifer tarandus platyrhynchus TaxID=3082113 RepID=A0ACB0EJ93_RANTA|nr:unnamed protein product [Rangifer tarandus platyrhynchus]